MSKREPNKDVSTKSQLKTTLCSVFFWCFAAQTLGLILTYYTFSIGLTFYQKWLIKKFPFPLSVVVFHLVVKFVLAALCRVVWECYTGKKRVVLAWSDSVKRLAPTGITSALDISLSNWSFELITVSLYTMSKSTSIVFILGFAILFKLEKKHWSIMVIVSLISVGLFMFTYHSTQFSLLGFFMVITASLLSGIRWTLAQMIMQKSSLGLSSPLDMVYHIQPWMIFAVLPFAIGFEGLSLSTTEKVFRYHDVATLLQTLFQVLAGALLAFLMEISEFMVVTFTSSLTLSIAGIIKEICTLVLAVEYNGDQISLVNSVGLVICLGGIILHVIRKILHTENSSNSEEEEYVELPLLSNNEEEEDVLFTQKNRR